MLNKLSDLHRSCFPNKPWSAGDFADLKKHGREVIASDNGFIVWRQVGPDAEIITIGVHPDARKKGVASAMLGLMEREILKSHAGFVPPPLGGTGAQQIKIFLEVAENNIPARKLYESFGYVEIGKRPKYYPPAQGCGETGNGIDAILMEKAL